MSDYEFELYHHGIKGMKWGVRRYDKKLARTRNKAAKRGWSEDARAAAEIRSKNHKQMSNAEIRKLNERTRLEREYKQLHPNALAKGAAYAGKAGAIMGTALALYNNSNTIIKIGKSTGNKIVDIVADIVVWDINRRGGFNK